MVARVAFLIVLCVATITGRVTVSLSADARLLDRDEARKVTGEYFTAELDALHALYVAKQERPVEG